MNQQLTINVNWKKSMALFLNILMLAILVGMAQVSFAQGFQTQMVEGELVALKINGKVVGQKIKSIHGTFVLENEQSLSAEIENGCTQGVFELTEAQGSATKFQLINVIRCEQADEIQTKNLDNKNTINSDDQGPVFCPAIYKPVCGMIAGASAPRTFSNSCMMNAAKATYLYSGTCEQGAKTLTLGNVLGRR